MSYDDLKRELSDLIGRTDTGWDQRSEGERMRDEFQKLHSSPRQKPASTPPGPDDGDSWVMPLVSGIIVVAVILAVASLIILR